MLYELYKSLYEQEVLVRHFYDNKISIYFTILSVTAATIYNNVDYTINIIEEKIQYLALVMLMSSCMIFVIQLIFTFRAFLSINYIYMDFPVHWIKDRIKEKLLTVGNTDNFEENAVCEINKMLLYYYEKCASHNYIVNLKKRKAHHYLNIATYVNIIVIILMYIIRLMGKGNL